MLYAIYADEAMYCGLHGMYTTQVVECPSLEEAEEIGLEESRRVMESYNCIIESIYEQASEEYEEWSHEWEDMVNEIMEENTSYQVFEIKDSKGKSIQELDEEFYNDKESFIKEYCL